VASGIHLDIDPGQTHLVGLEARDLRAGGVRPNRDFLLLGFDALAQLADPVVGQIQVARQPVECRLDVVVAQDVRRDDDLVRGAILGEGDPVAIEDPAPGSIQLAGLDDVLFARPVKLLATQELQIPEPRDDQSQQHEAGEGQPPIPPLVAGQSPGFGTVRHVGRIGHLVVARGVGKR